MTESKLPTDIQPTDHDGKPSTSADVYRILDANANRAGEGIRTMEECARFVLDDVELTSGLKTLRHDLASALKNLRRESLLSARDTPADVGTEVTVDTETARSAVAHVVAAAATRTAQSLRVLEEYGKISDGSVAGQIEHVRYRCYTIGGQLEQRLLHHGQFQALQQAQVYVLTSAGESNESFAANVQRLCGAGADIVQLRDRNQDDRTLYERSLIAARITEPTATLFIVNDRADLAAASGADGVHVGQDELPATVARQIVGADRLVGVSTHDLAQVDQAIADGADYIGCGPVFAGTTKCFDEYVGCLLYTSPSPRDATLSRMPSSA